MDGEPLAAVVIGDLDNVTHESWAISGMGASLGENIDGVLKDGEMAWTGQQAHLGPGETSAMVVWMGYDTPRFPWGTEGDPGYFSTEVLGSDHAKAGGERHRYALEGSQARAAAAGRDPFLSIMAHSFGSTTSAYALRDINKPVDAFVIWGSAGIDPSAARTAADLNVATDPTTGRPAVYATAKMTDLAGPIPTRIGVSENWQGPRLSPTDKSFGAGVFDSDKNHSKPGIPDHYSSNEFGTGYLDYGAEAADFIARLSLGKPDDVPLWNEAAWDQSLDERPIVGPGVSEPLPGQDVDGPPELLPRKPR